MTVAVSCNLSDGVILGVDSAVSVPGPEGYKVFENADKLFQLGKRPIGVATYGLGDLGARSIGSHLREFVVRDEGGIVRGPNTVADVVEAMRSFFADRYREVLTPAVEEALEKPAEEIPDDEWPTLGFVVGGFSADAYLSEVWHLTIPQHDQPHSAEQAAAQGEFSSHWWSIFEPIRRYALGCDRGLLGELIGYFQDLRGAEFTDEEWEEIRAILDKYIYRAHFSAMPMKEGIEYTRWLVELVVNHYRFAEEAPLVGGEVKIGTVTYTGDQFEILDPKVHPRG